jgi:hypothetical protein
MAESCPSQDICNSTNPKWKYIASIYRPMRQYVVFRDVDLGVQHQLVIRRNPLFFQSCDREYYYIDGVDRWFRNEHEMMRALQACGDNRQRILSWKLIEEESLLRTSFVFLKRMLATPWNSLVSFYIALEEIEPESERLRESGATTPL